MSPGRKRTTTNFFIDCLLPGVNLGLLLYFSHLGLQNIRHYHHTASLLYCDHIGICLIPHPNLRNYLVYKDYPQ